MHRGSLLWHRKGVALRKLFAILLSISFIVSPTAIAFAQEAGTDTQATDSSSSIPTPPPPPPPTPDFSIPGVDNSGLPADTEGSSPDTTPVDIANVEPPADTGSIGADTPPTDTTNTDAPTDKNTQPLTPLPPSGSDPSPTIGNLDAFTLGGEHPRVDGQSGAFTQSLKLDIPAGRNGLQPDLTLQYNSQRAEDSIVGYGWTISIPYIQHLNKTGSQNLYNAPVFYSSLDGELATTSSATSTQTFGARIEDGHFNSYSFTNNVWTMYDKNGTRYTFGASDNAQQNASASSTQIYTWMLQEIRDTNNNYVRYVYTKDSGQIYPQQIIYTGNGGADGIFTVNFSTATRPDTYVNYKPLFKVTTNYRISTITAAINGTTVREYDLSYAAGNNGVRSLLSSVQQTGWDSNGSNMVTIPAETFSYVNDTSAGFFGRPSTGIKSAAYVVADIQGNAKPDVTWAYNNGALNAVTAVDGGTSFNLPTPPEYWGTPLSDCPWTAPVERGVRFVDVNADGKADYVQGRNDAFAVTTGAWINTYSTSTGYSWSGTATGTIPYFNYSDVTTGIFGDVNGDGLPDYEQAVASVAGDASYLGNGHLWDAATTTIFAPAKELPTTVQTVTNSQLIDINADGLADWVYSDSNSTYVLLNNGTGWEGSPSSQWTIATSTLYLSPGSSPARYYDRGMRFIDVNGDGLPDFVRSYHMDHASINSAPQGEEGDAQVVFLNTGNGWATSTAYTLSGDITLGELQSGVWAGAQCYDEYETGSDGLGQNKQDVISTVTYPQGGTASVSYAKSAQGSNSDLPVSILTVSSIINNDGLGNSAEKDYTYSGGKMFSAYGVRDQKFAGFATVVETDANTKTTTYFNQGDTISFPLGEQSDGWGQINHPYRVDVAKASDSTLFRRTFYRWDTSSTTGGNGTFVFKAREVTQDFGPAGDHRDEAVDYVYSTSTGDLSQVTNYAEVSANSDGTFTDIGSDDSVVNNTYAHSTSTNLSVLIEKTVGPSLTTVSSTSTSSTSTPAHILVVGGGGGGGGQSGTGGGGGGGAGGYRDDTAHTVVPQAYSVTVGAGGTAGGTSGTGGSGGSSIFDTITSHGGGGGGAGGVSAASGASGGSGGGAGAPTGVKGAGTSGASSRPNL
jgi:hypothetical protein